MSYFLWYPFVHWEKLVLEKNGDTVKRMVCQKLFPERFGWLVILKFFKELFAQMKQKIKAQFECTAAWLNLDCLLQNI